MFPIVPTAVTDRCSYCGPAIRGFDLRQRDLAMTIPWPRFVSSVEDEPFTLLGLRIFVGLLLMYREGLDAAASFYDQPDSWQLHASTRVRLRRDFPRGGYRHEAVVRAAGALLHPLNFVVARHEPRAAAARPAVLGGRHARPLAALLARRRTHAPLAGLSAPAEWPGPGVSVETWNFVLGILFVVYAVNSLAALNYHLRDECLAARADRARDAHQQLSIPSF